jgi:REP element-mobilizing transposase RayT
MDENSLSHTKWECKYHLVFAPKFRRKEYIKNQEQEDKMADQLSLKEFVDPFKGGK